MCDYVYVYVYACVCVCVSVCMCMCMRVFAGQVGSLCKKVHMHGCRSIDFEYVDV